MAVAQVIAGHFTATYNSSALDYTKNGFVLHFVTHAEKIDQSDAYARTLLDVIYQGADLEIETICRVDSAAVRTAFWPWGTAIGIVSTTAAPHGRRGTDVAAALVLTVVAGTPAATFANPTTATASKAILAPDQNMQIILSSQAREVPLRWISLPAVGSSDQNVSKLTLT